MNSCHVDRRAFSAAELLAITTILTIVALIAAPRFSESGDSAMEKLDARQKAAINAAVERFYVETGNWPAEDLSDIGADRKYFPSGLPASPINGRAYKLDRKSHQVR